MGLYISSSVKVICFGRKKKFLSLLVVCETAVKLSLYGLIPDDLVLYSSIVFT